MLFHKFIQSWVGYELVKVLVLFGLQPTKLNPNLKNWSPDLHDIFSYMLTKKLELKDRADQILKVLFGNTLHTGHWTKIQFGSSKKIVERDNGILSLLVLTWLRQLQQFFLNDERKAENGDWNTLGKYKGTTGNLLKETPLANINFSTASETTTLQQIANIDQFKPKEDIKGVCTSLEEWALGILSPETELQVDELYNNDAETHAREEKGNCFSGTKASTKVSNHPYSSSFY